MKRIYLFLIFYGLLSISISKGETKVNISYDTEKEIDLSDNYPAAKTRSLIKPVQAFITDHVFIEVYFNVSLGAIALSIYDEMGNVVYRQSVDTNNEYQVFIDISSFGAGGYTIEFVNSQTDLSGEFEI